MVNPVSWLASHAVKPADRAASHKINDNLPNEIPSVPELMDLLHRGFLDPQTIAQYLRYSGVVLTKNLPNDTLLTDKVWDALRQVWTSVYIAGMERPAENELRELLMRGELTDTTFDQELGRQGWEEKQYRDWKRKLCDTWPETPQLIQLAQKQAWNPDVIKAWGLDANMPTYFDKYAVASGKTWSIDGAPHQAAGLGELNWWKAEWYAHWSLPPMEQVFEIKRRLRTTRGVNPVPRDGSGIVYTDADFQQYMSTIPLTPYWRDKIFAVSYRTIDQRHLSQLYDDKILSQDEVYEYLLDNAFGQRAADYLWQGVVAKQAIAWTKEANAEIVKVAKQAYVDGFMDEVTLRGYVYRSHLVTLADVQAFDAALPGVQNQKSANDPYAASVVAALQLEQTTKLASQAVAGIKARFLSGHINRQTASNLLTSAGVVQGSLRVYLDAWDLELHPPLKEFNTGEVITYARRGWISTAEAIIRLQHLGWAGNDIQLLLLDLARDIGLDQEKLAVEIAKSIADKQKAIDALAKAALAQRKAAHAALLQHGGTADLTRWVNAGLITQPAFVTRMAALGVPQDVIDFELAIVNQGIAAKVAKATAKAAKRSTPRTKVANETQITKWWKAGIIDDADWTDRMKKLGYGQGDIDGFIAQARGK